MPDLTPSPPEFDLARTAGDEPHAIEEYEIPAEPWTGPVAELEDAAASVALDLSQRLFLAGGAGWPYVFDQAGNHTG